MSWEGWQPQSWDDNRSRGNEGWNEGGNWHWNQGWIDARGSNDNWQESNPQEHHGAQPRFASMVSITVEELDGL